MPPKGRTNLSSKKGRPSSSNSKKRKVYLFLISNYQFYFISAFCWRINHCRELFQRFNAKQLQLHSLEHRARSKRERERWKKEREKVCVCVWERERERERERVEKREAGREGKSAEVRERPSCAVHGFRRAEGNES